MKTNLVLLITTTLMLNLGHAFAGTATLPEPKDRTKEVIAPVKVSKPQAKKPCDDADRTRLPGEAALKDVIHHPLFDRSRRNDEKYVRDFIAKYHLHVGTFEDNGASGGKVWTQFGNRAVPYAYGKKERAIFDDGGRPWVRWGCFNNLDIAPVELPAPKVLIQKEFVEVPVPQPYPVPVRVCEKPRGHFECRPIYRTVCRPVCRRVCICGRWRTIREMVPQTVQVGKQRIWVSDDQPSGVYAGNGYDHQFQGGPGHEVAGGMRRASFESDPTYADIERDLGN